MQALVEDFLQYLRHERGQAGHTQRTYASLLNKFVAWAEREKLTEWKQVELRHLMSFLQQERERTVAHEPKESQRRLSSESVYLEIAALRAFYRFAENEKHLPRKRGRTLVPPAPLETPAKITVKPGNGEAAPAGATGDATNVV